MWGVLQWLEFSKLDGICVMGKGIIDGQGSVWWENVPLLMEEYQSDDDSEEQDDYVPRIALVSIHPLMILWLSHLFRFWSFE